MSSEASVRIASRTEEREIPSCSHSAPSVGMGSPGARPSARIRSWIRATADPPALLLRIPSSPSNRPTTVCLLRPPYCAAALHLLRILAPPCASTASLRRATPLASPVRLVYAPIIGHHTSDLWGGVAVVPRSADLDLPVPGGAPRDRINPPKGCIKGEDRKSVV